MVGTTSSSVLGPDSSPPDVQATFCATLVDEWLELGVRHAVISPGSRSTPMAVAMAVRSDVDVHVVHDERAAAFIALGLGLGGVPALLLCTSGTAAANFFPAVVEAGLSEVPMIVITADRPEELRGVGAPQTIDQHHLYGCHVRWFHDPGVPAVDGASGWRALAAETLVSAAAGPIQLNLPFREPLLGVAHQLPARTGRDDAVAEAVTGAEEQPTPEGLARPRGVILVGGRSGVPAESIESLHAATGWPVIADPISGLRHLDGVITSADALLRHAPFADAHLPDVIVRVGRPAASKILAQWVNRAVAERKAVLVQVGGPGVIDPGNNVTADVPIATVSTATRTIEPDADWWASWNAAETQASRAITETLAGFVEMTEPGTARVVADSLPEGVQLVVSSSMPVRDHEWFGGINARAHANRGANGIDGVLSTGRGVALATGAAAVLIGDIAFLHDGNALIGLASAQTDLRVVVVDNDGGGIFSFLPQATNLTGDRFEQLFGTPHHSDVLGIARAHGLPGVEIADAEQLATQLGTPGPWVARVASSRLDHVDVHEIVHAAVIDAIS